MPAKTKKHKWTIDEFIDSARDHIGKFLDNLNARDLIYMLSYLAAVALLYEGITGIALSVEHLFTLFQQKGKSGTSILGLTRKDVSSIGRTAIGEVGVEVAKQIDSHALLLAMVSAYGILKLDLGDVTSAVSKVSTAVASVAL